MITQQDIVSFATIDTIISNLPTSFNGSVARCRAERVCRFVTLLKSTELVFIIAGKRVSSGIGDLVEQQFGMDI